MHHFLSSDIVNPKIWFCRFLLKGIYFALFDIDVKDTPEVGCDGPAVFVTQLLMIQTL